MKALPLWQPWATLVAHGAKRVETRSWPAPPWLAGERIAIHATKGSGPGGERALRALCNREPFRRELLLAGYGASDEIAIERLPRGAIVCTVRLVRCAEITEAHATWLADHNPVEHAFGDYRVGRYGWVLRDVERLPEPAPARGSQGFFDWDEGDVARDATLFDD